MDFIIEHYGIKMFKGLKIMLKIDWERIITPKAWIQIGKTDWHWDAKLNELLDNYPVEKLKYSIKRYVSPHVCKIGNYKIWIANYPYGYITDQRADKLPSVKTRKRLRKAYQSSDTITEYKLNWFFKGIFK